MRKRGERDMIVLGGWLFADLLLGLAMLFLTANTVGQAPPTATPPPTANLLATSEAANAAIQADLDSAAATATANAENVAALNSDIASAQEEAASARQTAVAAATVDAQAA